MPYQAGIDLLLVRETVRSATQVKVAINRLSNYFSSICAKCVVQVDRLVWPETSTARSCQSAGGRDAEQNNLV